MRPQGALLAVTTFVGPRRSSKVLEITWPLIRTARGHKTMDAHITRLRALVALARIDGLCGLPGAWPRRPHPTP